MLYVHDTAKIYQPTSLLNDERHDICVGPRAQVGQFCVVLARKFMMEEGAELCPQVSISGGGAVTMGKFSTCCYGVRIIPASFTVRGHYMNDVAADRSDAVVGSIEIGEGCYIGSNAVICVNRRHRDIKVGKFSVVASGTYVDRDVPEWVVARRGPDGKLLFTPRERV